MNILLADTLSDGVLIESALQLKYPAAMLPWMPPLNLSCNPKWDRYLKATEYLDTIDNAIEYVKAVEYLNATEYLNAIEHLNATEILMLQNILML